jgi:hypothetical protein
VTDWQDHPAETRAALAAVSQGPCYFPGCSTPIVVFLGDRPVVNVEIAHISESEPGRPRYVAGLSAAHRHSFDNLLLLCVPHRKTIDQDVGSHPIDLLETWKVQREAGSRGALSRLQNLTDERIDELLAAAFSSVRDEIAEALARFAKVDADSARLIRQLVDGLSDQRRHITGHDTAALLAQVTDRLGVLADKLLKAAEELRTLEHTVQTIDDTSNRLSETAETLHRLEDQTTRAEPAPKRTNIGWT